MLELFTLKNPLRCRIFCVELHSNMGEFYFSNQIFAYQPEKLAEFIISPWNELNP